MGTIISRKKRNAVITSQSVAAIAGQSPSETATPYLGNQATNQEPAVVSHDNKKESEAGEESVASDESDSEKSHDESSDDENESVHDSASHSQSVHSVHSVSSKFNESVTETASASGRSETKSAFVGVPSDEDFYKAWKEALLEDLDIDVSDNVKIVRIFTSSTFTDTFVERNALMERVYPRLKSYCQERGYDFQVVDMRWGVRDESTDDHLTTELCMRELRACQKLSTGPNFITFLGQKYGYRPFPAKIASSEFERLLGAVDEEDDLQLLKHWFWRDDNAVPAQYLLQPITSLLPDYRNYENNELRKKASAEWWTAFERMQVVLRMAADKVLGEGDRHKYHMSVTEDEIRRGIITVSTPEKHCFWFKRVITDLIQNAEDRNAGKFVDKTYGAEHSILDESAQSLLTRLRENELPASLGEQNVLQYKVKWTSEGISPDTFDEHAKYLDKLCTDVYNILSNMIQEAILEKDTEDKKNQVTDEVLQHALFCQRKGLACQGRDNFLSLVKRSLLENDNKRVIVLHGESGCGKTSIMAKIAVDIRKWLEPESAIVVLRFIGTSPNSSNIRLLLRSICQQLYMITENDSAEIPEDLMELQEFFPKCLDEACNFRPVAIMLDSLDQLPAGEGGRRLDWLPRKLPDNCYFVLSTLPGSDDECHECFPLLKELYPDSSFMEVPTIPANEADLILESWLSSSQRTLTTAQKQVVLNAFKECPLPLFLKLSSDEACRWKSYTTANEMKLASSIKDIINYFLDQLERRHGKILVSQALAYVTASRNGLTEPELEDILSLDDVVLNDVYQYWTPPVRRLPPLLWIRIRSDLGDYLIERGADDARVIYWYHRQFIEVATNRYLKAKKEVHTKLADFFTGKWSDGAAKPFVDKNGKTVLKDRLVARQPLMFDNEKGKVAVFNLRKLSELPYHLLQAGDLKRLKEETLCNFEFLLAKLRATSFEAVLDDFTASLLLYPEDEDLVTLEKTLQLSSFALKGDASQLAPQLLGRLMVGFDLDKFNGIQILLQQAYFSSVPCLISSDKCLTSPGGSLISSMKIPGESSTQCCGFSCDGKTAYIASSSLESLQLLIINLWNGKTLQRVTIPESQGVGLVWSIQGSNVSPDLLLLAGSADIILMKASTGQIIQKFAALAKESQYSPMPPVAFADNETRIIAITDENLKIWTVQDGHLVHQIDIGEISTDEEYGSLGTSGNLVAFCVHVSRSFKVLDCRTGKALREVKVFSESDECCIAEVKVTSKEQVVVTSSERNNLRLYDLHSGDLIREVPQFRINSGLLRLQVTKDGAKAVGIHDYEILITDLEDGTVYKTLKSESFGTLIIHQNLYTVDGKFGISIAHDEVIRIYDLEQAVKEKRKAVPVGLKNHKAVSSVDSIAYLTRDASDDRHIIALATVNETSEILIWDSFTGTKVRTLKVTQDLPPSTIRMHETARAVGYIHDKDFLHFQMFDLKAGKIERRLQGKASKRTEAFGFTDESHIITFSRGRRNLKVWNINDGKLVNQYKFGQKFRFEDMLISRNGDAVVCSQVGQTVEHDEDTMPLAFLNPKTGEQRFLEEKGTQFLLWNGCISDDGRYLVCLTKDYSAQLWDLTNGRMMHRLSVDNENTHVIATAISTVSNVVLTGESEGGINVWDITSGHVQYTFYCDDVDSLFITKDGRVAFSNYRSSNRNIDAWDLSSGSKLASFTSDWKPERMAICGNRLVVAKADKPELMSLRPHIPGYAGDVVSEDGRFMHCPLESQMQPCLEIASGQDEDEDEDDDFDQTDIQKTELTKKAVYASPNVIIGGGSSVFASKNIFISGNVTINGIPIQDL